ncbi:MAG: type III-B CRISPR module RAMP protein Cmr1 [Firmicutes bacterium]|jgi:CRISPR-associated protein Cmr1|nr:type III-B CRISPR module RAMP protein Cmr1 [Bacillota bacterium]
MRRIEATYYVATPLFLGGADNKKIAEIRPPSLKGLLRFWFRATSWPQLGAIDEVWREEQELFGSTNGQGKFLLSVTKRQGLDEVESKERWRREGLAYLGYGAVDKGITVRPYLRQGGRFTVTLIFKEDVSAQQIDFLTQSIKALGLFGGAGARSRKGFGSLSLSALRLDGREVLSAPANFQELVESIKDFLKSLRLEEGAGGAAPLLPYTAFSPKTRVYAVEGGSDPLAFLDDIGRELMRYRGYGLKRGDGHFLFSREPAEQNFADDHDLILDFLNGRQIDLPPRRAVFGLPHNYYFKSTKQKADVGPSGGGAGKRRASPLFIHIHALNERRYAAVLTLMPAVFLPQGTSIAVSNENRGVRRVSATVDFNVIEAFLERPGLNAEVVWP